MSAFGAHVEKKSCKEGMGQLNRKIKNLRGGKKRLAVIHTKIDCQKNDVSPEHETCCFLQKYFGHMLCHLSLEIFVANCPPDELRDPDM